MEYIENLEIRRIYNSYNHKEYFYEIGNYKEENKTDIIIEAMFIQKGFPGEEIKEAINEFNDFMKVLSEKKLI